jgi:hypothetical protein
VKELVQCLFLFALGALPVIPVALARPSRSHRAWVRLGAKFGAFVSMFLFLALHVLGAFLVTLHLLGEPSTPFASGCLVVTLMHSLVLSYWVAFR